MSHTPHELVEEFPEHAETIHRLKEANGHFARLFDEYHQVNRAIHRPKPWSNRPTSCTSRPCASSGWC